MILMEGIVTEVESYSELKAIVFTENSTLLKYGTLAMIYDEDKSYLALVTDVSEKNVIPAIDQEGLQKILNMLDKYKLEDARKIFEYIFSPNRSFIKHYSVKELSLKLLGEFSEDGLTSPSRPPRPFSHVSTADKGALQRVLLRGLDVSSSLVIGELIYNPGVVAALDPKRLTMHMAIVGQTGSGKTETVKRLVFEYALKKEKFSKKGGILLFDVAGEYTGYPYSPSGTYPLLQAILNPQDFVDSEIEDTSWINSSKKTIIVPVDLNSVPTRAKEERALFERIMANFITALNDKYGLRGFSRFVALIYGRHGIYLYDPKKGNIDKISYVDAIEVLDKHMNLVVMVPLPSVLDVDIIMDLVYTASEIFPGVLEGIASRLGTLEGRKISEVIGISLITDELIFNDTNSALFITIVNKMINEARSGRCSERSLEKIIEEAYSSRPGSSQPNKIYQREVFALKSLFTKIAYDFLTYHDVQLNVDDPLMDPCGVLKALVPRERDFLKHFGGLMNSIVTEFKELIKQTKMSVKRALRNLSWQVSAFLTRSQFMNILKRVTEGFAIVHLAPPSRGANEYISAMLIDELFSYSVANFDETRRTLIVVEEAHNLAPANERKASNKMLLRVAREGRKWGLSLVLVSQRPGFIDANVLSQASTLIALRVSNPTDISSLKKSVESVSQELLERMPDLDQGQAVVSGIAVPERRIPLLVRVKKLEMVRRS